MTDFAPTTVQLPSLAVTIISSLARNGIQALAAVMVSAGALQSNQVAQFSSIGVGVLMWGATIVWSMIEKNVNHKTAVVAVAQAKAS